MTSNSVLSAALVLGAATLATHSQTPAPAAAPTTKIAIVDIQAAILNSKDGQRALTEVQNDLGPKELRAQQKQEEIQALQDRLTKGSAAMSEDAKERLAVEIQAKSRTLSHDVDDLKAETAEAQARLSQEFGPKMYAVVGKYASQNGYHVVLDVSNPQAPVYWAASSTVITNELVKSYDQAHPAKPAATVKPPADGKK